MKNETIGKEKPKKRGFWKRIQRPINLALAGAAILHTFTQAMYSGRDVHDKVSPSAMQQQFNEEYGFHLRGDPASKIKDHEINERYLNDSRMSFADTIRRENCVAPINVNRITIRDDNYLSKNILDQLSDILTNGDSGHYIPSVFDSISLGKTSGGDVIIHELKHARAFDVIENRPELLERWSELSRTKGDKSSYRPKIFGFASRFKLIDKLVPREKRGSDELIRSGFISDYATTNVHEDIAELCAAAEGASYAGDNSEFGNLESAVTSENSDYEIIKKKIKLAEEYGLISEGFADFVDFFKDKNRIYAEDPIVKEYISKGEKFIKNYPRSVNASNVARLVLDAKLPMVKYYNGDPNDYFEGCARILKFDYVEPVVLEKNLSELAQLYEIAGDRETMRAVNGARNEYRTQRQIGNIKVDVKSVRKNLEDRGVNLDNLPKLAPGSVNFDSLQSIRDGRFW